jgi:branched-chain amino acid aminotransferase
MESKFIWMNGELVPFEKATVHFLTPALHYGIGAFEGIRCYNTPRGPAVFRLAEHLQRLLDSIHILGVLEFPYSLEQLRAAVHETVCANGFSE